MSLLLGGLGTPLTMVSPLSWDPTQWLCWAVVRWDDAIAMEWPRVTSRLAFAIELGPNSTVGWGHGMVA